MASATEVQHTPEELLQITDRPMPELIDGQFVERPPMGRKAGFIAGRILRLVGNHVEEHDLGVVNGSEGSFRIFPDDPRKVRIPDVSFARWEKIPEGGVEEGHGTIAPDLVVEVLSPRDLAVEVSAKGHEFLNAGVLLVWVANPETCEVFVHRADGAGSLLRSGDILDGGDVLPGFQYPIADLFKLRDRPKSGGEPR
jgi:Uma2 family endonuclease